MFRHFPLFLIALIFVGGVSCTKDRLPEEPQERFRIEERGLLVSKDQEDISRVFVLNGKLYYTNKEHQRLFCLDMESKTQLWEYDLPAQTDFGFVQFARLTADKRLLFGNSEECLVLDIENRQILHKAENPSLYYAFINKVDYADNQLVAIAGDYQNPVLVRLNFNSNTFDTLHVFENRPEEMQIGGDTELFVYFTTATRGNNFYQEHLEYHQIRLSDTSKRFSYPLGTKPFSLRPNVESAFAHGLHFFSYPSEGDIQAFAEDWRYNAVPWRNSLINSDYNSAITSMLVNSEKVFYNNGHSTYAFHAQSGEALFEFKNNGQALDLALNDEVLLRREGILNDSGPQAYRFYDARFGDKLNDTQMNFIVDSTLMVNGSTWLAIGRTALSVQETQLRLIEIKEN